MRRLPLVAITCVSFAAEAAPRQDQLCRALSSLADEASLAQRPRQVVVLRDADTDGPVVACQRQGDSAAQAAFCAAVLAEIGVEFAHQFPWLVRDCLRAGGRRPVIETADEYTGQKREKIVHMTSQFEHGTRLDLRFTPSENSRPKGYHGRYSLTIATGQTQVR